jgi:Glycosyl transferase family 2
MAERPAMSPVRMPLNGRLRATIRHTLERCNPFKPLADRIGTLEGQLRHEQGRVDYLLGAMEGVLDQFEAFRAARETEEYQRAFTATEPLVTVCIGTSQRARLLTERCLPSVIAQTYRNLQIIVVGDHCTDDTESRIAALRDSRITFHNLPERGPYPPPGWERWCVAGTASINAALERAEGAFVTHLDDDDRYTQDRIARLVAEAQRHRADLCWHALWTENWDGSWRLLGNGRFEAGQVTTGSMLYHRYLVRVPWDVMAYRLMEPGDWNRLRKIKLLRPRMRFLETPLLYHYKERNQAPFEAQEGERFLD